MKLRAAFVTSLRLAPLAPLALAACSFEESKAPLPYQAPTLPVAPGDASVIPGFQGDGGGGGEDYPVLVSQGGTCGDGVCDPTKFETDATCIDCAPKRKVGDGVCEPDECVAASPDCGTCIFTATQAAMGADGSAAKPYALAAVLAGSAGTVKPGDTIWVTGGNYGLSASPALPVTLKGTAAAPIRVEALPGQSVVIAPGLAATTAEFVSFSRITIVNDSANRVGAGRPAGIDFNKGLRLQDVQVYDTGARGVVVRGGDLAATGLVVQGTGIRTAAGGSTYDGQAVRVEGNIGPVDLRGSIFSRNFTHNVDLEATTTGGTVNVLGCGFLDAPDGALLVNPDLDTAVGPILVKDSLVALRGNAGATGADRGVSLGIKDDINVRQDKVELVGNVFASTGTDKGEPLVALADFSGYVGFVGNTVRGPNLVRSLVWPTAGQQWASNRYIIPGGTAQGLYFEDGALPAPGVAQTYDTWKAAKQELDSTIAYAAADDTRILGTRLDLRELRAVLLVSRTQAKATLDLDLRPYLRAGESYTLVDGNARGFTLQKTTVFDGRPLALPLTGGAPPVLAGTATDLAAAVQRPAPAPLFYAIQIRVSPP